MAKKKDNTLLWVGGAVAAYFLFFKPKTPASAAVTVAQPIPAGLSTPTAPLSQTQPSSLLTSLASTVTNLLSPGSTPNPANQISPGSTTTDSVQQIVTAPPAPDLTAPNDNALEDMMYKQYQQSIMMSGVKRCNGFMKEHYYSR